MKGLALIKHLLLTALEQGDNDGVTDGERRWVQWARGQHSLKACQRRRCWQFITKYLNSDQLKQASDDFTQMHTEH